MGSFPETLIDPRFRYEEVLFPIVLFLGRRILFVTMQGGSLYRGSTVLTSCSMPDAVHH